MLVLIKKKGAKKIGREEKSKEVQKDQHQG
jgi:hypothetical protein